MSTAFEPPENDEMIEDFFNFSPLSQQRVFNAPQKMVEVKIKVEKVEEIDVKREVKGVEYAKRPIMKEEQNLAAQSLNIPSSSAAIDMFEENDETLGIKDDEEDPELPELSVFQRYQFNVNPKELPILYNRGDIIKKIHDNRVIVLSAMTGTGKSSQIPQYILEEAKKNKENCNIIITQPRRIAAITLAKRVALERKCDVGTLVGYQVGLDKKMDEQQNSDTRILFCTTGILVRKLIAEKSMKRWTHVILDEVHERDIEMDFLIIIVRRLLASRNPYVKVILMSATLNAEKISRYFTTFNQRGAVGPAPMIKLKVDRPFKINIEYLGSVQHLVSSLPINPEKPGISNEMYEVGAKTMDLVAQKLKALKSRAPPSFLVFLPGIQEIQRFKRELQKPLKGINIREYSISVLHSSFQDQTHYNNAFDTTNPKKIILATNIAESSLTLPGVTFVIDFCLTKYLQTDTATNMSQLKLDWASLTSLEQRAGRVGRLEPGQVVRLINLDHYNRLQKETVPEMQRASLESVVLKAKQLNMGKPSDILALALDPPNRSNITDAILVLKEIGGLTRYKNGIFTSNDGDLTFAGDVMASLPVDVRISKLIILGFVFSCVEECIIIGAGLSSKPIFANVSSIEGKMNEYQQKLLKARGTGSDAIMILNVYREWRSKITDCSGFTRSVEKKWCEIELLDLKNLRDLHESIEDIKQRMDRHFGISAKDDNFRFSKEQKLFAVKICIAGAFYPNYFTYGGSPPWRDQFKDMNNMDLCKTVYLKGMRPERIGKIYERQVREKLKDLVCDNLDCMKVNFDRNSARLQVKFESIVADDEDVPKVPGEVRLEVYKALKLAKLQKRFELKVMSNVEDEINFALENELGYYKSCRFELTMKKLEGSKKYIYPKMCHVTTQYEGRVTHIINCGKFFFQPEKGRQNMLEITEILAMGCRKMTTLDDFTSDYVIINHKEQFKRGRIIERPEEDEIQPKFVCLLIDYGMVIEVPFGSFYACAGNDGQVHKSVFELPPQCYECRLSEVIPSAINCPSGWSETSTEKFKLFIAEKIVTVEINAFVERVASVQLYAEHENLIEYLVLNQFAQRSDDSYIQMFDQLNRNGTEFYNPRVAEEKEVEFPPHEDLLNDTIKLDGPISSLERRVESLCRGQSSTVTVDQNSVNHIVIDPFPYDGVKKMMVAASLSNQNESVTLSKTTLMGHLPGMASLLVLLFSPVAELRCNAKKTRYSTILSGLGCDENRKPHYSEHDQLIFVDVELDSDDFKLIENLRSTISILMQADPHFKWKWKVDEKKQLRNKACTLLKKIVKKERRPLGITMESSDWNWQASTAEHQQTSEAMLPPHPPITELLELSEMTRRDLRNHAEELTRKARTNSRDEIIMCQLCNETIETVVDLQLHIMKNLHKEQLMRLRDESQNVL